MIVCLSMKNDTILGSGVVLAHFYSKCFILGHSDTVFCHSELLNTGAREKELYFPQIMSMP